MQKKTYKLYHGENLMPWAKGTAVKAAKGFIFLSGTEGHDPTQHFQKGGGIAEGAEAQWWLALEKIRTRLEEMGSSLENIVHLFLFVAGPFPNGAVNSPNYRLDVLDNFFRQYYPPFCSDNNPPASTLIGVASLADPRMVVEIQCIAAIP